MASEILDLLIIGAGPAGLHAGWCAQQYNLSYRIVEKKGLVSSFQDYPQTLRFFSPPDEMEICEVPLPARGGEKPTREDILPYFRETARYKKLNLSLWETITDVVRTENFFEIKTQDSLSSTRSVTYRSKKILLACGVWEKSIQPAIPGIELPHVRWRFDDPTEYFGTSVIVVGGGNSAATAALSLAQAHATVHLITRRRPTTYQSHLRPFVVRDLEFALEEKRLVLTPSVTATRVVPDGLWVAPIDYNLEDPDQCRMTGSEYFIPAKFILFLLGRRPDANIMDLLELEPQRDGRPFRDDTSYETNRQGIYVIGSVAGRKINIITKIREQAAFVVAKIASS